MPVPPYCGPMHVTCPNCAAAYDVPDRLLAAGPRVLQCTKCSHKFSVDPSPQRAPPELAFVAQAVVDPVPVAADQAPPPPPPLPPSPRAEAPAPKAATEPVLAASRAEKGTRGALLGWIATICLLALGVGLVAGNQAQIAAAWPPAERLFDWVRLGYSEILSALNGAS